MPWPNPQDYTKAIANPERCFADQELAAARVSCNAFGAPQPITGNFANVYQAAGSGKTWAIKCFLRNVGDQSERYIEIQRHFARYATENTTMFEFVRQGIQVNGQWHPIVKMDWVEGDTLDTFILNSVHNPRFLVWVADQFKQMSRRLNKAGIAHGDLHHGNIFVTKTGLRLVDYDGAFVPALAGMRSNELGHHNYQHPKRTPTDFGPHLDNFSAWVIYTSLICISQDNSLWQQLAGGDECLLFRSSDLGNPLASYAFALLEQHESEEVRIAARNLRMLCDMPLDTVPVVGESIQRYSPLPPLRTSVTLPRWIPRQVEPGSESNAEARTFPDYRSFNEAMRSPAQAFEDSELQQSICLLEDTKVGANGRVYHFIGLERDIAVKCFSADSSQREARYAEIIKANKGDAESFMVPCEYVAKGVYVNGDWYPILKMPWVKGQQIDDLPSMMITDALASYVADQFATYVLALRRAGLAHGDLELSNIIVDTDQHDVKIVDYDNMFVPALTRMGSMELGNPGFQSPRRTLADYGPYVDNFSAWLVHFILKTLAINSRLADWVESCIEEERQGSTSHTLLRAMENDRDSEVRQLGRMTRLLLARPLHLLPDLNLDTSLEDLVANQSKEVTKPGGLLKKRPW